MKYNSPSPLQLARTFWVNRHMMRDMTMREAIGRYKGSFLGVFWALLTPLIMLAIYTFVFGKIFRSRWGQSTAPQSTGEYAMILFVGLIIFNFFADILNRSVGLIVGNVNFVTKVIFPLELLPCVTLLSSLFNALISLAILLVVICISKGGLPLTALYVPIVLLPFLIFCLGVSWWLSATSVYLRDLGQTISIIVSALMFVSPIFFPIDALPQRMQLVVHLNPLTYPIEQARDVLLWGAGIHWHAWSIYSIAACLFAWSGLWWFQKTRKGFADVL